MNSIIREKLFPKPFSSSDGAIEVERQEVISAPSSGGPEKNNHGYGRGPSHWSEQLQPEDANHITTVAGVSATTGSFARTSSGSSGSAQSYRHDRGSSTTWQSRMPTYAATDSNNLILHLGVDQPSQWESIWPFCFAPRGDAANILYVERSSESSGESVAVARSHQWELEPRPKRTKWGKEAPSQSVVGPTN